MQVTGTISWNKIARPLCSCTSLGDAHEGVMGRRWAPPALLTVWGTGAARPWGWLRDELFRGKGTILCVFHLTNHRQFVFERFGYCAAVGIGCIAAYLTSPLPHPTPQRGTPGPGPQPWPGNHLHHLLPGRVRGQAKELQMLRAPACSS